MAVEIPEFKSCCLPFLLDLHGCFKIIAYVFIIPVVGYFLLIAYLMRCFGIGDDIYLFWILYSVMTLILFILLITDFIVTIVFFFRGDEENLKLIRRYYKYNIGVLIVMTMLMVAAVSIDIAKWNYSVTKGAYLAFIAFVVMQAYFILLLRSQVIKLESSSECKIVNNSVEV